MKAETKAILEALLKRKLTDQDIKVHDVLEEIGDSEKGKHPVEWCLIFGKRCFEIGKSFSRADILARVNGPLKDELDRILGDDEKNLKAQTEMIKESPLDPMHPERNR